LGRQVLAVGALVVAAGYGVLVLTSGWSDHTVWLVPGLLVSGFGMGMVVAPLSATVLAGVTPQHAASAAGVLSTAQEAGGALGIAVVGVVFFSVVGSGGFGSAFHASLLVLIAAFAVVAGLVQLLPRPRQQA
jgi:MFS family permease